MESVFHKNKKIRILLFAQFINEKVSQAGDSNFVRTFEILRSVVSTFFVGILRYFFFRLLFFCYKLYGSKVFIYYVKSYMNL